MLRSIIATTVATAALLGATAAQAGTHWSVGIGINVPPVGVVVDSPRYVEPAPVYYAPPPPVYVPAPRYYAPRDVYYAPAPRVVYDVSYRDRRWDDGRRYGRRDNDGDGVPNRYDRRPNNPYRY